MKASVFAILCLVSAWGLPGLSKQNNSSYVPVHEYSTSRNPAQDVQDAREEAKRTGKRVLIVVGGDWASWCHTLDKFFAEHKDLVELRESNFVMVKVNFSKENQNREFLSHYPKGLQYPHFFVEEADGTFLQSQRTALLEQGESYDPAKIKEFLQLWAPEKKTPLPQ